MKTFTIIDTLDNNAEVMSFNGKVKANQYIKLLEKDTIREGYYFENQFTIIKK